MDFYSVTLALALAAAVAALGLAAYCWLAAVGVVRSVVRAGIRRGAWFAGVAALVLVFASAANHRVHGHRPGSSSELAPAAFVLEHPAFGITPALVAGAFMLLGMARKAQGDVDSTRQGDRGDR